MVIDYVSGNMTWVSADQLGLDQRCGFLWVNEDSIACSLKNRRALDYYGGFEYVDHDDVAVYGDYVFYSSSCGRVQGHIDHYYAREEE